MDLATEQRLARNAGIFKNMSPKITELSKRLFSQDVGYFPVRFYCECSNEHCQERVKLTSDQYQEVYARPDWFVVLRGHENSQLERLVREAEGYVIVEKTPES